MAAQKYTTQRQHQGIHSAYPAGTKCMAERLPDRAICLTFKNGEKIYLPPNFYLKGIEDDPMEVGIMQAMDREIIRDIDRSIFGDQPESPAKGVYSPEEHGMLNYNDLPLQEKK